MIFAKGEDFFSQSSKKASFYSEDEQVKSVFNIIHDPTFTLVTRES
jgi:hypothetical protein